MISSPNDDPENYLTDPAVRLEYFSAMAWLRRYDLFFPISADTGARLQTLYGPTPAPVTGVALPPWMTDVTPEPPRHILMIGGEDARKNPDILLRAHASSPVLRGIPLILTGQYSAATQARFSSMTSVNLPGRLPDAAIRALYAQAYCVVTPSRAEGFSLPVIEAMAAQTPAIVSDIPAHRALVPDPAHRFAPDDAARLTAILEALITAPTQRDALIAQQSPLWRPFTGDAVATKLWSALTPAAPAILRGTKPRLAFLTPLPPEKSGVADYSAALAAALKPLADLTLVSGPRTSALAHASAKFDYVLSAIGNSPLHAEIYDLACRWGSAALCHDSRLLGLATRHGLPHAAALAAEELARPVTASDIAAWAQDETKREASFLRDLAHAARPLIFHNRPPVALVQARFGVTAHYLPFAIYRPFAQGRTPASRAHARNELGLDPAEKIIASFGFIGGGKGIAQALHAFAKIHAATPSRLIFVGEPTQVTPALKTLAERLGIAAAVTFGQDFIPEQDYRHYLLAADCALQLREGGPGNISGALQDGIAAGLPAVASRDLAENIDAPSYVKRVSDELDPAEIATALAAQLDTRFNTEPERQAYCATHSMANYASSLLKILALKT